MKNKMISMSEILDNIDMLYNYAQDPEVIKMMNELDLSDNERHLINRRHMLRLFEKYARINGIADGDYSKVIKTNGAGTKATRYNSNDINKVITHPEIKKYIRKQLDKKAKLGKNGTLVPILVFHKYAENNEVLELTGFTPSQLQLFSVPDDLLLDSYRQCEQNVNKLKLKIEKEQIRLNDIFCELQSRGFARSGKIIFPSHKDDVP